MRSCNGEDNNTSETGILIQFRDAKKEFSNCRIIKTESPDFTIQKGRKKSVGIKLTSVIGENRASNWLDIGQHSLVAGQQVASTIARKEKKLEWYRKNSLDEPWLIIYTAMPLEKQKLKISAKLLNRSVESAFNRVLLFRGSDMRVLCLK